MNAFDVAAKEVHEELSSGWTRVSADMALGEVRSDSLTHVPLHKSPFSN